VHSIQRNKASLQIQPFKELAGHRNLIGLVFFHDRAAQVKLARNRDGAEHSLTAPVIRFLAIQDDQVFLGRLASRLFLNGQDGFLNLAAIDLLKKSTKGRLVRRRIFAFPVAANPQSPTLRLAKPPCKLLQILLASGRLAQHCQQHNSQQRP